MKYTYVVDLIKHFCRIIMMMTWYRQALRITGPLWRKPLVTSEFPSQKSNIFDMYFADSLKKLLCTNCRVIGNLKRHHADVISL